jgi:tetratricopeptide (TPR) repeat protein
MPGKILLVLILGYFSNTAAKEALTMAEINRLPAYCRGVQTIRGITKDPVSIETHMKVYGEPYYHLHHYCLALIAENRAVGTVGMTKRGYLNGALGDIDYSMRHAIPTPSFIFLPEMYTGKARVLLKLGRAPEAVGSLYKALQLKPDYAPAALQLSRYFERQGERAKAIAILKTTAAHSKTPSAAIARQLKKLGASPAPPAEKPD